ncbi:uncharacterized protein [Amphiura filiformis]|uniref:uncharacterized protein n=1 Tax=Amphiura filiformis TaxID=82378 RepID=UPI003B2133FB
MPKTSILVPAITIICITLGAITGSYLSVLFQSEVSNLDAISPSSKYAKSEHLPKWSEDDEYSSEQTSDDDSEVAYDQGSEVAISEEDDQGSEVATAEEDGLPVDNITINEDKQDGLVGLVQSVDTIANVSHDSRLHLVKKFFPEILKKFSYPFLKLYKEPCFRKQHDTKETNKTFCLPYFYMVSPPKSATTDLWFNMHRHPFLVKAKGGESKEPHWWTRSDKSKNKAYAKYLGRQSSLVKKAKKNSAMKQQLISGDGSCSTIWDLLQIRKRTKSDTPPFIWGDVIHAVTPDVKIITILRNPVDRTISDYFAFGNSVKNQKSPQHFHENLTRVIEGINKCLQENTLLGCVSKNYGYPRPQLSVYYPQVREWVRVFTREQMFILRTEDWIRRSKKFRHIAKYIWIPRSRFNWRGVASTNA